MYVFQVEQINQGCVRLNLGRRKLFSGSSSQDHLGESVVVLHNRGKGIPPHFVSSPHPVITEVKSRQPAGHSLQRECGAVFPLRFFGTFIKTGQKITLPLGNPAQKAGFPLQYLPPSEKGLPSTSDSVQLVGQEYEFIAGIRSGGVETN